MFDSQSIKDSFIHQMENIFGLESYKKTLDLDNVLNNDYQRNFTYYYKIRRDKGKWLDSFYTYMYENRNNKDITFRDVLEYLSRLENKLEMSFTSKMLHTLNNRCPIWDSQVCKALRLYVQCASRDDIDARIAKGVEAYNKLIKKVDDILSSPKGGAIVAYFDMYFPNYTWMSETKKVDTYLWSIGK